SWAGGPATGDFGPAADDEFGIYRSNGSRQQRDDLDYRGAAGYDAQQPSHPGGPADTGFRDSYPNEAGHLDDGPLYRDEAPYADESPYTGDLEYPDEHANLDDGPRYRDGSGYPDGAGYPGEHDYAGTARPAGADRHAQAELYGQIAIYTLLEDRVEDFDRLTRRVVRQVRTQEPDTLVFIVHAVPSAPMQRILYEVYRDRSAHEEHKRQPYVMAFEADRRPLVLATNIIELGLQQAKVSPLPSVSDLLSDTGYDLLNDSGFGQPGYGPRPGGSVGRHG
ncbi:MAG: antibiotic biosynthesis monooxygenase, partial [Streptosporangiaceae bacterium]